MASQESWVEMGDCSVVERSAAEGAYLDCRCGDRCGTRQARDWCPCFDALSLRKMETLLYLWSSFGYIWDERDEKQGDKGIDLSFSFCSNGFTTVSNSTSFAIPMQCDTASIRARAEAPKKKNRQFQISLFDERSSRDRTYT